MCDANCERKTEAIVKKANNRREVETLEVNLLIPAANPRRILSYQKKVENSIVISNQQRFSFPFPLAIPLVTADVNPRLLQASFAAIFLLIMSILPLARVFCSLSSHLDL